MKPNPWGVAPVLLLAGLVAAHGAPAPFGVGGTVEAMPNWGGPLGSALGWIAARQTAFYRELTGLLKLVGEDRGALLTFLGLSFVYGVFHAAGPGHGKAVISSYVLANNETLRRGVVLSFLAALMQGLVAVVVVAILAAMLGVTSMVMTDAAMLLEIGGYGLMVLLGLFLVWRKILRPLLRNRRGVDGGHAHDHEHAHHDVAHHHDHTHDANCGCGHAHMPAPEQIAGHGHWREKLAVIVSIGVRPCSGALIVLVFALSQGLFLAGIASTFIMALGTALTVSALATMAVGARGLALRLAGGGGRAGMVVHRLFEAGGALAVLLLGLLLFSSALMLHLTG